MLSVTRGLQTASIAVLLILTGCSSAPETNFSSPSRISIREAAEPDALHPVNSKSTLSHQILSMLHQKLMVRDYRTVELEPMLAADAPRIAPLNDSIDIATFQIRQDAKWPNDSDITAKDVVFSFKAAANPLSDNALLRNKLESVQDVFADSINSKVVHLAIEKSPRLRQIAGSEVYILSKEFYDPDGLLDDISFSKLQSGPDSVGQAKLEEFSKRFNSAEVGYNPERMTGCGPYKLKSWDPGQRIIMQRRGDESDSESIRKPVALTAFSEYIEFDFISEDNTALSALENGYIDVLRGLRSRLYADLESDSSFRTGFHMMTAPWRQMNAVAINCCNEQLSNKFVRQALGNLINRQDYIREVLRDKGEPVCSFLHPMRDYAIDCPEWARFDPERANFLLDSLGISDTDNDGLREMDGKAISLKYLYNQGNKGREYLGLMLRQSAKKAGIEISLEPVLWNNYLKKLFSGDYDLAFVSLTDEWGPPNPGEMFSSELDYSAGNVMCFNDTHTDSLISVIENTQSELKTPAQALRAIQQRVMEQSPIIPVSTNVNRLIFSRRLERPEVSAVEPGYWPGALRVAESPDS